MKILLFFLYFPILVIAQNFSLSSQNVHFDGQTLKLSGDICLDHDIGKLKAKDARFEKEQNGKLSHIFLKGDVELVLKTGGRLTSETAYVDLNKQTIELSSANKKIIFEDFQLADKTPLFLSGHKVKCRLKSTSLQKASLQDVIFLSFYDNVEITYDTDFHVNGDKAKYAKGKNGNGEIFIYAKSKSCRLSYHENEATASFCHILLDDQKLELKNSKGYYNTPFGLMNFSSEKLYFDKLQEKITLEKNIIIENASIGKLHAEQVEISKNKLKTDGKTKLTFPDHKTQISCQGHAILDNTKKILVVKALHDDEQVLLQDEDITILTDQLLVHYEKNLKIKEMILEGNIRASINASGNMTYGYADKIIYSFINKDLVFTSEPDKRVVFWQDSNQMKLSTKELKITKSRNIEGIGNVRFSFDIAEGKYFKKMFSKYMKKYERNAKSQ